MGEFCKLDLTCPVPGCGPQQRRHLLLEGGLKFKLRDSVAKTDVYCFLFTDMLLITKPNRRGDKVKVTKPPMRLDKCVVHMLRDGVSFALLYLNEYHMATAVHTFHGESAKVWVDHIRRAQVRRSASCYLQAALIIIVIILLLLFLLAVWLCTRYLII